MLMSAMVTTSIVSPLPVSVQTMSETDTSEGGTTEEEDNSTTETIEYLGYRVFEYSTIEKLYYNAADAKNDEDFFNTPFAYTTVKQVKTLPFAAIYCSCRNMDFI